jgi:hypothetical protein
MFLTEIAKAALPPRVVAVLDEPPQAQQVPGLPVFLEGLTLGLTGSDGDSRRGGSGDGLTQRNLACLLALVAAAMFLAGTLGPIRFEVLEVLQNADYVFTTRGTGPLGSAALGPNTVTCRITQSTLETTVTSLPRSKPISDAVKQSSRVHMF